MHSRGGSGDVNARRDGFDIGVFAGQHQGAAVVHAQSGVARQARNEVAAGPEFVDLKRHPGGGARLLVHLRIAFHMVVADFGLGIGCPHADAGHRTAEVVQRADFHDVVAADARTLH